jgi:YfiR/HmsC-like
MNMAAGGALATRRIGPARRWLLCTAAGLLAATASAAAQEALEASVKAAYVYKFLAYVDWPPGSFPSAEAPQVIGVMRADAVQADLDRLVAGRRVNGRPLVTRKIVPGDSLEGVHVLYVGRAARVASAVPMVGNRPILVITDVPTGLAEGGALNFVLVDGRVRFEASPRAADRLGLRLSSRLLAVAERVASP